jgi:hypothetical protein
MGTATVSSRVKRQGREADHSPPSSAEVKNGGALSQFSKYLHGIVLNYVIKYRDNFTFTFFIMQYFEDR